jgi:hypothetical protein
MPSAKDGSKRVTIRKGNREIQPGNLEFEATNGLADSFVVCVTGVWHGQAKDTPYWALAGDGFTDIVHLLHELGVFYPDLTEESEITCIEFQAV